MGSSEDAAIVARLARRLDWPALVVEGGVRLADLMAIAGAAEGVFMINRAPSAGARDLISRAFYPALKDDIARHDPLGVAAEFLASFEAKAASTREHVPAKEAFTDAIGENDRRPPTNLVPTAAPVRPDKVAEPASAFTPSVATLGNDARHLAAVSDMRRTTGSRFEDFEMIPDDDSWKKRPDPAELARNARLMQAYTQRQRRQEDDADNIMQRMSDRSSGLQSDDPRPPRR